MEIPQHKGIFLIIIFKISITIFGAIILGVGLHSHYQSSWLSYNISRDEMKTPEMDPAQDHLYFKPYQICEFHNLIISWGWATTVVNRCPGVEMEEYVVAVIIMAFAISLAGLLLLWAGVVHMDMYLWQAIEVTYHGIFCILLLAAGIIYIESASGILSFSKHEDDKKEFLVNLMTQTKITAGAFTIMQSLLYGIVAGLIGYRIKYKYDSTFK